MAVGQIGHRFLPVTNKAPIAAGEKATLTFEQNQGGVFTPTGFMVFYGTGLKAAKFSIELQGGAELTLGQVFFGDLGSERGGDSPAKVFPLSGMVLPSGTKLEWEIQAGDTAVDAEQLSVVLVGDYSADGGP